MNSMAKQEKDTITAGGIAYFVHVAEPNVRKRVDRKTGKEVTREVYEMQLVLDSGSIPEVRGLIDRTAANTPKWPASDAGTVLKKQAALAAVQSEVNNIDAEKSHGPLLVEEDPAGKYFPPGSSRIALSSSQRPGVVVSFRQTELGGADFATKEEIYSGMRCKVRVSAYSYDNEKRGVGLNLGHLQVTDATLPRLGGASENIADVSDFGVDKNAQKVNSLDKAAEAQALV